MHSRNVTSTTKGHLFKAECEPATILIFSWPPQHSWSGSLVPFRDRLLWAYTSCDGNVKGWLSNCWNMICLKPWSRLKGVLPSELDRTCAHHPISYTLRCLTDQRWRALPEEQQHRNTESPTVTPRESEGFGWRLNVNSTRGWDVRGNPWGASVITLQMRVLLSECISGCSGCLFHRQISVLEGRKLLRGCLKNEHFFFLVLFHLFTLRLAVCFVYNNLSNFMYSFLMAQCNRINKV